MSDALLSYGWLFLFSAVLVGCDTSFDPFEENELYYSVFGYLDAGADSQFVRVSPLRDSVALADQPIDAEVTLQNKSTGEAIVFQDSIFRFNDGRVAINYWTGESIDFNTSYTLSVVRSDGVKSTVTVTLPGDFPEPELSVPVPSFGVDARDLIQGIRVDSVGRMADMKVLYQLALPGAEAEPFLHTESYLVRINRTSTGFLAAFNAYDDLIERFDNCPLVIQSTAFVALAGPDWPELNGVDLETIARPDVVNNVDHGVGYVGSISSKSIDWPELTEFLFGRYDMCLRGLR